MNELTIIENGLIPVYQNEHREQLVNARELHEFLGIGTKFTDWIKDRIQKYGFVEGEDYIHVSEKKETSTGAVITHEYILTIDTAKEIAMVQNNEKGSQVRKYFLTVEKKYKRNNIAINMLSPQLQMFNQLFQALANNELEQKRLRQEIEVAKEETATVKEQITTIKDVIAINPKDDWRKKTNLILNKIGGQLGDYKRPKNEAYLELEKRAGCNLERLLENMIKRAEVNGAPKKVINELNYLDVIDNNKRLKEIYIAIAKEMAIKYGVKINKEAI